MKVQKFYRKAIKIIFASAFIIFSLACEITEAATYNMGIVGIENRVKNTNLDEYTEFEDGDKHPLIHVQELFHEIVLNGELYKLGLKGVESTKYSQEMRNKELEFQKYQSELRKSISQLENGDTYEVVKLFDKQLDYLIYGYINNMTVSHRESFGSSNSIVSVNISVRIVDASTGKIVCVATGEGSGSNHDKSYKKSFRFENKPVEQLSFYIAFENAMNQVVEKIKKQA